MTTKKRPVTERDQPAYPRRQEHLLARRGLLALLGGAASLSIVGCHNPRGGRATAESAADDLATAAKSAQAAPTTAVAAPETSSTALAGPAPTGSADAADAVVRRLPLQGHRAVAITPSDTVHYAVEIVHPDPKFGAYVQAHQAQLLAAADAALRTTPPYQWRNDDERAKTESALRTKLQARLAEDGWVGAPITAVRLEVQSIEKRPQRKMPGVPRRHTP